MSKPERRSPAACGDRARKSDCLAAVTSEFNADLSNNQTIALADVAAGVVPDVSARRVAFLARSLRISPEMAATIAPMVFGEGARG